MLGHIVEFLDRWVDGKTLYTDELVYKLENGALEGVYSDQVSFCGLKHSASGFQFDMFLVANEKIYRIGEDGRRGEMRKDFSAVSLFRYELAQRRSTGDITGIFRFLSASGKAAPPEAVVSGISGVAFADNVLSWREEQALYRDQFAKDGDFKPVAFAADQRFYLEDGKLHFHYATECFDIDRNTSQRIPTSDRIPPFHSKER